MYTPLLLLSLCIARICPAASPADSLKHDMKEVEVKAFRPGAVNDDGEGRIYWNMASLEEMPHLLGATDPLRCLQLLPGITTNNDYATGIHVQGCSPAHTLPEIDGAPVFNASHLLGLFSIFTTSHFRGMSLTKNRHNASFGNYLGGQLSFHSLDSIARSVHLNATFSFMESEGTVTLPAGQKGTVYLSARGSYLNLLYGDLMDIDEMTMNYSLQDYNLTYVVRPDEKNKVQLNLYHGKDKTDVWQKDFQGDCQPDWQNTVASLNWQRDNTTSRLTQTVFFSRYGNRLGLDLGSISLEQSSVLFQTGYKGDLTRPLKHWEWNAGVACNYTSLHPMEFCMKGSYLQNEHPSAHENAFEAAAYTGIKLQPFPRITLNGSIRLTGYGREGKAFFRPEPRITLQWNLKECHEVFLHYGMYSQYLHQVSLSNGGLPVDFWISSSSAIRPESAHSLVAGYRFESPRKIYELSVELYYKRLKRQYEYRGSIFDILTGVYDYTGSLMEGDGENYGLDLQLKRNRGRLTGWLSYSLSRSRRQFPKQDAGTWYNAAYDRPHDLSVVASYKITPNWSLNGDFVFASGTPYTSVRSLYMLNLNIVNEYGKHNGSRLPPTHRMDLSLTYRLPRHKKAEHSMNLSVFNVYAHRNTLFRYMDIQDGHYGYKSVYSLCRALPSIGYSLKF